MNDHVSNPCKFQIVANTGRRLIQVECPTGFVSMSDALVGV